MLYHHNKKKKDSPELPKDEMQVEGEVIVLAPEWYGAIGNLKGVGWAVGIFRNEKSRPSSANPQLRVGHGSRSSFKAVFQEVTLS